MTRAQPPLEFIPPALNLWVLRGCQALLSLWLRSQAKIDSIEARNCDHLAELYSQFQQGKVRLLLAFRHPSTLDPLCLAYLLWKLLPQAAQQAGISLKSPVHAHFLYDRGIPLWAGDWLGWLASRLGGTSIQRGKLDTLGLRSARQLLANSPFPLAAAPEGGTNGHSEIISPLEPGIAQLSFWCVEDLQKAHRHEEVLIVPIGIRYRYVTPPWLEIAQLLTQLEQDSGLVSRQEEKVTATQELSSEALYPRLYRLGEHLLWLMEDFYRQFYHQTLVTIPQSPVVEAESDKLNGHFSARLQNLLDVALRVAEDYFKIEPKGNFIDRCRRLEQAGWDCIYREELKPSHPLAPVERGLANLVAEEADLRLWHMRLVERFVAVTGYYVKDNPTAERFAETTLLVWDLVSRLKGENVAKPQLGRQRVNLAIGQPLSVSQRWTDYRANRRQAVAKLTQDLQKTMESLT
jgi:hypothetical protein